MRAVMERRAKASETTADKATSPRGSGKAATTPRRRTPQTSPSKRGTPSPKSSLKTRSKTRSKTTITGTAAASAAQSSPETVDESRPTTKSFARRKLLLNDPALNGQINSSSPAAGPKSPMMPPSPTKRLRRDMRKCKTESDLKPELALSSGQLSPSLRGQMAAGLGNISVFLYGGYKRLLTSFSRKRVA